MLRSLVRSLGVERFLEWGAAGGIVVFWDNMVLELVDLENEVFSISCHFKNCEDGFIWTFTGVYGPTLRKDSKCF